MFLRRQQEVASVYAELINSKRLTAERITDTILRGPASVRLFQIIERKVNRAIDETAGLAIPYIVVVVGIGTKYITLKHQVCDKIMAYAPDPMRCTYEYTEEATGIEPLLRTRAQALTPAEKAI